MLPYLKNRLIENSNPVGVKRTSNWKLPPSDFYYGKKLPEDEHGVGKVIRSWMTHSRSKLPEPPQDFVKINKLAVKLNATNYYVSYPHWTLLGCFNI